MPGERRVLIRCEFSDSKSVRIALSPNPLSVGPFGPRPSRLPLVGGLCSGGNRVVFPFFALVPSNGFFRRQRKPACSKPMQHSPALVVLAALLARLRLSSIVSFMLLLGASLFTSSINHFIGTLSLLPIDRYRTYIKAVRKGRDSKKKDT